MGRIAPPLTSPEVPLQGAAVESEAVLWTTVPVIALFTATGVLFTAFSNFAAVRGVGWSEALFWLGLLVLVLPSALVLASPRTNRNERLAVLLQLGLGLYLVKIMHSPVAFTFPDEFIHLRNLNEILTSNHLFNTNGILPATPYYPGLEIVTSALASLSGLSAFHAGLVVIGAARVMILLALFLLYEQLSGSARVAGIGALLYTANSNYLFWSAQYSYESLSLPLAVVVLLLLLWRDKSNRRSLTRGLTIVSLLVLFAVIITHHLTSYAVVLALWGLVLVYRWRHQHSKSGIRQMALVATLATVLWLGAVALPTVFYLAPVFRDAVIGVARFVGDPASGRALFQSNEGNAAPIWERVVALSSVGATVLLVPLGLVQLKREFWNKPFALLLGGTALLYPALLTLRLTRTSWEISNRTSEFLFVGLSFVVALALVEFRWSMLPRWRERFQWVQGPAGLLRSPLAVAPLASLLFVGGVIAGWPPNARMASPYQVETTRQLIYPQSVTAANWMGAFVEKDSRVAADYANARLLVAYGQQYPLTGSARGVRYAINAETVDRGVLEILHTNRVQYVVVDRRRIREDPLVGMFFIENLNQSGFLHQYFPAATYEKFDRADQVSRFFDSGDIYIYHVEALSNVAPPQ